MLASEMQPTQGDNGLSLEGKRALVTGGGQGIGRQITEALAEAGAAVVICGRQRKPLEEAAKALSERGLAVVAAPANVTDEADLRRLHVEAGTVDILVNNAGYAIASAWQTVSLEEWREVMAINVEAPLRLAQLFVPGMIERGWGRVINVASVYGVVAADPSLYADLPDAASYITSKHAVIGLTKHLAVMVGGTGVTVNALSPGMFPLARANAAAGAEATAARIQALADRTPLHRIGGDEDLRAAAVYLASPGSSFYTGQNLVVDGGWTIW